MTVIPHKRARWTSFRPASARKKAALLLGAICLGAVVLATFSFAHVVEAQVIGSARLTAAAGAISGTVVNGNDKPVAAARLRLRDLETGRILMTTRGDEEGRFLFTGVPAGAYVVELVDEGSQVQGVTQSFGVTPGETARVVLRLASRQPWYSGFFSNAAIAAVSSAASLGVTSVGTGLQPDSGRF
jgi:hypothetical protein